MHVLPELGLLLCDGRRVCVRRVHLQLYIGTVIDPAKVGLTALAQVAHRSWSHDSREPYEMCCAADLRVGLNISCL